MPHTRAPPQRNSQTNEHCSQEQHNPLCRQMLPTNTGHCNGNQNGTELRQPIHGQNQTTTNTPKIHCWKQFIDDIFVIWTDTEPDLENYVPRITQLHNTIKFTYEANPTQIQFLDTIVYKDTDHQQMHKIKVKTYIKTTNKQLYVPADSFHSPGTHKGVVIGEAHRYRTTNTDEHNLKQMIHHHTKN